MIINSAANTDYPQEEPDCHMRIRDIGEAESTPYGKSAWLRGNIRTASEDWLD